MTIENLSHKRTAINGFAAAALLTLSACAPASQNRYGYQDVGNASVLEFGTVVSERQVEITGQSTGIGAGVGAGAGALAGAGLGNGNGSLVGLLAGAVIGGVTGAIAEQALADRKGIEYIITLQAGVTESIVQNIAKDDKPIDIGARVVVQTSGSYKRVLPADALPNQINRPQGINVTG